MKANNGSKADGQSFLEFVLQDYSVGFAVFTMAATLFTELQAIFQCDDAAADEILKHLMPAVITGGLIKEFKKGFFVINPLFHACFLRKGNTLPEGKRCSLRGEKTATGFAVAGRQSRITGSGLSLCADTAVVRCGYSGH